MDAKMTKLEQIARAIRPGAFDERAHNATAGIHTPSFESVKAMAMNDARAAVEAMRVPCHNVIKAMAESKAVDEEGEFPHMTDLLDFSGENKTHTVLVEAWECGLNAILNEEQGQ